MQLQCKKRVEILFKIGAKYGVVHDVDSCALESDESVLLVLIQEQILRNCNMWSAHYSWEDT